MKLFQIEEPEGGPADPGVPGIAIGIDLSGPVAIVAVAVGGNAVVLNDREGFEQQLTVPDPAAGADHWEELFVAARLRAERALARPATHVIIAVAADIDAPAAARLAIGAEQAGLSVLRLVPAAELPSDAGPALAAAIVAEDLAPRPEPGGGTGANLA
ncbi:MAG TPA: hypothetical protein VMF05_08890 [Stellaceae bacterium]|nr:hypothetical protein [Stellaceae bacterium]